MLAGNVARDESRSRRKDSVHMEVPTLEICCWSDLGGATKFTCGSIFVLASPMNRELHYMLDDQTVKTVVATTSQIGATS